jgi:predicted O-methyltransferase YrrM
MTSKALQWISLLPQRPKEFFDRMVSAIASRCETIQPVRPSYTPCSWEKGVLLLQQILGTDLAAYLDKYELAGIEVRIQEQIAQLGPNAPFSKIHNGDLRLARLSYALARALRPNVIVETGVCYGVTSAYLLEALRQNGKGHLHSVDLPPLAKEADSHVGRLIPEDLRNRWTLHRGTSRRILTPLIEKLDGLDMFLHDSLHTYSNMRMEFSATWSKLRPGGVLIADDIEGNTAFQEQMKSEDAAAALIFEQSGKRALFGIAMKRV